MMSRFLAIVLLLSSQIFGFVGAAQTRGSVFRTRENNVHAPQLYADKLDFMATLVDLPGAKNKQSYWELSYQLYFVPEETYWATVRRLPRNGQAMDYFSRKILIAEGYRKKTRVGTLANRTIALTGLPFKQKVPDAQRTKFAVLITSYAVKIYDAELGTTLTDSGMFVTDPFGDNQNQATPRQTIYLTFGVSPNGSLSYSQLAPAGKGTFRR
jgi:hypothetical protein